YDHRVQPRKHQALAKAAKTMNQPPFEVADIIRQYGNRFVEKNRSWLTWLHLRVLYAIEFCRTATLGGHLDRCSRCGHEAISFNSCRNRHLSEVPDQRARPVAGRTQQRTAASQLRTCRLRLAARALLAGSTEQEGRLRSLVPYQRRDSAGGRCRPQTSRSGNRLSECAPHLGPEFATSSAHSL